MCPGWRRWSLEPVSEAVTLGTGGLVLMLALAVPAFHETSDDDWLKKSELAVTFLDRYGNEIGKRGIRHDDSIPLDELPDHLIKAMLATEDRRFFEHFGIDVLGTFRALLSNARAGGVVQGGSSITQQLAKNLFLSNERTLERKIKEAFLALGSRRTHQERDPQALSRPRLYGRRHLRRRRRRPSSISASRSRDVNLAEAAMLAGLFKAPTRYAPHINLPAARARANLVLSNLVEAGFMTEGQVVDARRHPAMAVDRRDERSPNYFLDWAFDEMKKLADTLPKTVHDRVFVVRLALDVGLQKHADKTIESMLKQYGREYNVKQSGAVLMDVDGSVRAMVGGRDYGESQFNRASDALRQPGSSFKPYVYAAALASGGFKPTSIVVNSPVCIGNWCPKNYSGGFSGSMTFTHALVRSINVIPVKLSIALGNGNPKVGRAKIRDLARKMGLRTPLIDTPSMPIGANEVTVLDHTAGYTAFPNGGMAQTAHAILEVRTGAGDVIWRFDRDGKKPQRVFSQQVANDMNMIMNKVVEEGTAKRAQLDGIKAAGKTGTTNAHRDAWFVGYTGNFVLGIWYGNDDYAPMGQMTGGSLPAMTWKEIMTYAHQGVELKPIPGVGTQQQPTGRTPVAAADPKKDTGVVMDARVLTRKGAAALVRVERLMDDATRALVASGDPSTAADAQGAGPRRPEALAAAPDRQPAGAVRGN